MRSRQGVPWNRQACWIKQGMKNAHDDSMRYGNSIIDWKPGDILNTDS